MIDYDTYLDRQTDKYLAQQEMNEECSNCCGAPIKDTDICTQCEEHCEVISVGEYEYDAREAAECDAADSKRDLERER